MKAIVCEMCGSQDLIKQEGMYVCQNCGTKYSVEEARKLFVEGTVKIDHTEELENLYTVAQRCLKSKNYQDAKIYYDMILVKDPTSWEATFYSIFSLAMDCKIAGITSAANSISNCLPSVMSLLKDTVKPENQLSAVNRVTKHCIDASAALSYGALNHFGTISYDIRNKYDLELQERLDAANNILFVLGYNIVQSFGGNPDIINIGVTAWKSGLELQKTIGPKQGSMLCRITNYEKHIADYNKLIKEYDEEYTLKSEIAILNDKKYRKIDKIGFASYLKFTKFAVVLTIVLYLLNAGVVLLCPGRWVIGFGVFVWIIGISFMGVIVNNAKKKEELNARIDQEIKEKEDRLRELHVNSSLK